jgi:predicted nucleotidyltransferase
MRAVDIEQSATDFGSKKVSIDSKRLSNMNTLAEVLTSRVRAEIFRLLFGVNQGELHMREIERQSGFAMPTVRRELQKLARLDLVKTRKDSNRLYYSANQNHPLFPDIRTLVLKTIGLVDILRDLLQKARGIRTAFVFGSVARGETTAGSDVDLLIVGDIGLRDVTRLLSGADERIGREINPHVLTVEEFRRRRDDRDHFLTRVIESSKLFIIGSEHELG